MARYRSVVAALSLLLFAQAAAGDCLTPPLELRAPALPAVGPVDTTMIVDDFDSDGIADVVFVRSNTGHLVTLQRGMGNGFFATPADIYAAPGISSSAPKIQHVSAKDLNRDGKLDLLILENRNRLVFLPGNGDGTFSNPVFTSAPNLRSTFAIADLTGDGVDDVAALYYGTTSFSVVIFAGSSIGTFVEAGRFPLATAPADLAAGDLDGDGANDLVISHPVDLDTNLDLLFGNYDGTFDPPVSWASGQSWHPTIKLADLENDGDLDIVTASSYDRVAVHRNRGGRTFDAVTTYHVEAPTTVKDQIFITVADVTGDGERDLLVANSNTMLAILRGLGDATFDHPRYKHFSGPSATTWAPIDTTDFDGDGRLDVIIGPTYSGGLRALRNRCGDATVALTATPPAHPADSVTAHVSIQGYDDTFAIRATGTVSILEGATVLATGTLSHGEVTLNVRALTPGAHKLVARYSGDDQYEPAQSAPVIARVTQSPATTPPPRRRGVRH